MRRESDPRAVIVWLAAALTVFTVSLVAAWRR
jgi:hypothetical protein